MSIKIEDMKYLSKLAKLEPNEANLELYAKQCGKIILYMDELSEVNTENVEPLYSPVSHNSLFREDIALHKRTREEILSNAPLTDGSYFIVPKIVEGK